MAESPTSRTLKECRARGWRAYVCEKWVPNTGIRRDAFGFGDLLVMDSHDGALLIQACIGDAVSTRTKKIVNECHDDAREWLARGNRIEVWGWRKGGPQGKRKLWRVRRVAVTLATLRGEDDESDSDAGCAT